MPLRADVARLAHQNPDLRTSLLPLLREAAETFDEAVKGREFRHPETGNQVQFKSLPPDEQAKLRKEWAKGKGGDKGEKPKGDWKARALSFVDKVKGASKSIRDSVAKAPQDVQRFVADPEARSAKLREMAGAVKKSPQKVANRVFSAAKAELKEIKHAGKAVAKVLRKPPQKWTKEDKEALYSAAVYVALATLSATGGGAVAAAGTLGKSFALHVGIKAMHKVLDKGFVHFEAGEAVTHALHLVASEDDGGDDEKYQKALVDQLTAAVGGVLADGITEDEMADILKGTAEPDADKMPEPKVAPKGKQAAREVVLGRLVSFLLRDRKFQDAIENEVAEWVGDHVKCEDLFGTRDDPGLVNPPVDGDLVAEILGGWDADLLLRHVSPASRRLVEAYLTTEDAENLLFAALSKAYERREWSGDEEFLADVYDEARSQCDQQQEVARDAYGYRGVSRRDFYGSSLRARAIRLAYSNPDIRDHLLPLIRAKVAYGGTHVAVRDLPAVLQRELKALGYGRRDIEVKGETTFSLLDPGGDGYRGFSCVVNLETGHARTTWGSWGGANPFSPTNAVDLDDRKHPVLENMAVIQGHVGGGRPVYASITVHPSNLAPLLPAEVRLTPAEKKALNIIAGIKGGYRKEEFFREGLGTYEATNPLIVSLVEKGLVKITGAGIQVTTAGRNAR